MGSCRAVYQSDAARINLISPEFIFSDRNVHIIAQLVNEQIAPVAQIICRRARDFLRDNLFIKEENFF